MKYINKKHTFAFLALLIFGIGGFTAWNSVQGKVIERVVIENKTRSLSVVSIKSLNEIDDSSIFEVTFKNTSEKLISIYRFRVSDEFTDKDTITAIEKNGLANAWTLKPGETSITKFSANSKGKIYLTVAALLFEDGTGDGDEVDLTRLQEIRTGVWMGFDKIVSIMKASAKAPDSFTTEFKIESLEKEIDQISDKNIPDNYKRGFAFAKSYAGFELKDIREKMNSKSDFNSATKIADKLAEIELTASKLSVNLPFERREK